MPSCAGYSIEPLIDTFVSAPPTRLYPSSTDQMWAEHPHLLESNGHLRFGIGSYVVQGHGRVFLIDLGVGPTGWTAPSGAVMSPGHLLDGLRELDLDVSAVTDVIFTHLHPDHVGWATIDEAPTFVNATYRCDQRDWDHFVTQGEGDPATRSRLSGASEHFETWHSGSITLAPGMTLVEAPGHTPGSAVVVFSEPTGQRAVLLGDAVHCAVELVDDDWETIGDVDPVLAKRTRERLAKDLATSDTIVSAAHFPELQFGRLVTSQDRSRSFGYV